MKPCPFCGCDAAIGRGSRGRSGQPTEHIARGECSACRASTDWLHGRNPEEAARMATAAWNQRTEDRLALVKAETPA